MIEIKGYKCEHCSKLYQRVKSCELHEKLCRKNPENWTPCFHCAHFVKGAVEYDQMRESSDTINHYCKKYKEHMMSVRQEHYGFGNDVEGLLPNKCEKFELLKNDDVDFKSTIAFKCLTKKQKEEYDLVDIVVPF